MAKAQADIRSLARSYAPSALNVLRRIADSPKAPPAARVSAATALLDRGYGKPAQMIEGNPDKPIEHKLKIEFIRSNG